MEEIWLPAGLYSPEIDICILCIPELDSPHSECHAYSQHDMCGEEGIERKHYG